MHVHDDVIIQITFFFFLHITSDLELFLVINFV